jgi:aryl-alcohol dehydrogenase-like predicted oxidoreductase
LKAKCREAAAWCAAQGLNIAELGMRFALANPRIHCTLSGALTPDEVRANIASVGKEPDAEAVAAVQRIVASVNGQVWASGMAEYN